MITLSANKVLKGVIAILIIIVQAACATSTEVLPTETSVANTSTLTAIPLPTDTPTPEATSTPTAVPISYPPNRGYHSMVYASESNIIILYGGSKNDQLVYDDIWSYETNTNTWTMMDSLAPELGTLAYDSNSDRVLNYIFFKHPETGWKPLGKMLAYDYSSDSWLETNASKTPYGYIGAQMAYDSESDRIIFFGGYNINNSQVLDETWSYNFSSNAWIKMDPEISPPGRNYQVMVYHPEIDRVVMFGGDFSDYSGNKTGNDTWEYDFNTDTWEKIDVLNAPPDHYYSSMVFVSSLKRIILFGGMSVSMGGAVNDMWVYDHIKRTWIELKPDTAPSERAWHAMAYDSVADKIILFGGGPNKLAFTDETWVYDPQANMWTEMTRKQ